MHRNPRRPLLLAALSLGLMACTEPGQIEPPRPNVVVIVVDTLRADRLPFYGCPVDTAPFLTELAERSLVFENAWSPSSWTLPATVSMLTSTHPFQHGINSLEGLELGPDDEPIPVNYLSSSLETLPEVMASAGYRTYGVVSNILVGEEVGFERGFDRFVRLPDEDADAVNHQVDIWRPEMLEQEPFFLYLHYFDPHDPFHVREPWFELPESQTEAGWPDLSIPGDEHAAADLGWLKTRLVPEPEELAGRKVDEMSDEERRQLVAWFRAAYDSEIGFVDARIRSVYEQLGLDEAVVVFLADHGEEFYEHGDLTHGQNLYAETTRVPLLLQLPGSEAATGRVAADVSTLDVVPTLRRLLNLPPSTQDRGADLLSAGPGRDVVGFLESKSGQHRLDEDLSSIVAEGHRLIAWEDGRRELYDLEADPMEQRDLVATRPDLVSDLLARLHRLKASAPVAESEFRIPPPASEEMIEHLQGLGYVD